MIDWSDGKLGLTRSDKKILMLFLLTTVYSLKEVSSNSRQRRDDHRKVPQVDATAGTQGGVSVFWSGLAERSFGQLRARKWFFRRPVAVPTVPTVPTVLVHRGYLDGTVPGFIVIARAADPDLRGPPRSVLLVPNRVL